LIISEFNRKQLLKLVYTCHRYRKNKAADKFFWQTAKRFNNNSFCKLVPLYISLYCFLFFLPYYGEYR